MRQMSARTTASTLGRGVVLKAHQEEGTFSGPRDTRAVLSLYVYQHIEFYFNSVKWGHQLKWEMKEAVGRCPDSQRLSSLCGGLG